MYIWQNITSPDMYKNTIRTLKFQTSCSALEMKHGLKQWKTSWIGFKTLMLESSFQNKHYKWSGD